MKNRIMLLMLLVSICLNIAFGIYIKSEAEKSVVLNNHTEYSESQIIELNKNKKQQDKYIVELEKRLNEFEIQNEELFKISKYYINRPISKVYDEKKEVPDRSNDFWEEYEIKLYDTNSLKGVIDLYLPYLDGAYSEGYGAILYYWYNAMGSEQFIKSLALHGERYDTYGIVNHLIMEMELYYSNDGEIDLVEIVEDIESNDLATNGEKAIAYQILSNIEEMIKIESNYKN